MDFLPGSRGIAMVLGFDSQLFASLHSQGRSINLSWQEPVALFSARALTRQAASGFYLCPMGPAPNPGRPAGLSADHRRLLGTPRRP